MSPEGESVYDITIEHYTAQISYEAGLHVTTWKELLDGINYFFSAGAGL